MKRNTTAIAILVTILVLTAISAKAQSARTLKVEIPFEFIVDGETYQPGEYTIGRVNPQRPLMLILKDTEGTEKKVVMTQRMRSKNLVDSPTVVFSKYDDTYFLSEVWTGSTKNGLQLPKTNNEKSAQRTEITRKEKVLLIASLL